MDILWQSERIPYRRDSFSGNIIIVARFDPQRRNIFLVFSLAWVCLAKSAFFITYSLLENMRSKLQLHFLNSKDSERETFAAPSHPPRPASISRHIWNIKQTILLHRRLHQFAVALPCICFVCFYFCVLVTLAHLDKESGSKRCENGAQERVGALGALGGGAVHLRFTLS